MDHDCLVTTPLDGSAPDTPEAGQPSTPAESFGPGVQPTGRPTSRMRQTAADMVRSMAVVLAVVFVIVLLAWRPWPEAVKVVETAPVLAQAVAEAEFAVLEPTGLAPEWRATSARWEPTVESGSVPVLHIGYVTPQEAYAQVVQSTERSAAFLAEQTDDGRVVGSVDVAGQPWEQWASDDRTSLVRADGSSVVIVSGSASVEELTGLAASLAEPAAATTG